MIDTSPNIKNKSVKLIFITVCGIGGVLLLAYGANAEFNVIQGRPISDAQEEVIAALALAALILGSAIWGWLQWRTENPQYRRWWKD